VFEGVVGMDSRKKEWRDWGDVLNEEFLYKAEFVYI